MAAEKKWKIYHFNIASAYLNGTLEETVYMELPQTTSEKTETGNHVCLLKKGLYGLKQGGRQWNICIDSYLKECGFLQAKSEPCIYFNEAYTLILGMHVDDLCVACETDELYEQFGSKLKERFKSKDLGEVKHLLSMHVERNNEGEISIDQHHLIDKLLEEYKMEEAKGASTPLVKGLDFREEPNEEATRNNNLPYRQLLGSLMYLANCTRPDLSYATSYLSQFNENFDERHWGAIKHILRYLKDTRDLKLRYCTSDRTLDGYCDADWGSNVKDRKSFGGYVFLMATGAVTWSCRKQRTTALSSTEAEFLQMTQAVKEAIWIRSLLNELNCGDLLPKTITIFCDNQGAIHMANNKVTSERSKHIEISNFFVRDQVEDKIIKFVYVPSKKNVADMLTKTLSKTEYETLRTACNLML